MYFLYWSINIYFYMERMCVGVSRRVFILLTVKFRLISTSRCDSFFRIISVFRFTHFYAQIHINRTGFVFWIGLDIRQNETEMNSLSSSIVTRRYTNVVRNCCTLFALIYMYNFTLMRK